ncbi:hypothetical protein GGR53DRAFT_364561 [Hypoxylon sp. FL1150]|nr:hypothetical protein GGR53DRAFT_364561 [Hypoxylon sp. FL1150]
MMDPGIPAERHGEDMEYFDIREMIENPQNRSLSQHYAVNPNARPLIPPPSLPIIEYGLRYNYAQSPVHMAMAMAMTPNSGYYFHPTALNPMGVAGTQHPPQSSIPAGHWPWYGATPQQHRQDIASGPAHQEPPTNSHGLQLPSPPMLQTSFLTSHQLAGPVPSQLVQTALPQGEESAPPQSARSTSPQIKVEITPLQPAESVRDQTEEWVLSLPADEARTRGELLDFIAAHDAQEAVEAEKKAKAAKAAEAEERRLAAEAEANAKRYQWPGDSIGYPAESTADLELPNCQFRAKAVHVGWPAGSTSPSPSVFAVRLPYTSDVEFHVARDGSSPEQITAGAQIGFEHIRLNHLFDKMDEDKVAGWILQLLGMVPGQNDCIMKWGKDGGAAQGGVA